ncbi:MAG: 2-amino-4-hydroxy-6-hydroxymethyldihydropteridine diphosphokinase, partial [Candidatus Omnitrophica bacterium]|nr:2-amino-4-hydroxy-6-hydroxymethyldihydropteridine diphosphokinase [Candidatus Omnitrophota bacterium]
SQGLYLNTVWEVETDLDAFKFMRFLLEIESSLGRKRAVKNGPRVIDLDLLLFGDQVINEPSLTVPHPRLQERWFVLKPLWDLRSDLVHPVFKKSVCKLLDQVNASH